VRLCRGEHVDQRELVEDVGLEELEAAADRHEVLEAGRGRLPDDAEHLVALAEEQLGEQRAVLSGDSDDEGPLLSHPGLEP
jgi:hypothetical protein